MILMMHERNLPKFQETLVSLIHAAKEQGGIYLERGTDEEVNKFTCLVLEADRRQLTRRELERLVDLVQKMVELPYYTTTQAAAWWGMTQDGIAYVLWPKKRYEKREGPLVETIKVGNYNLIPHDELVRYQRRRDGEE